MAGHAPSRLGQTLLGLLFALIGIVLLGGTVLLILERHEFLARAQIADGIVSRLNAGGSHPEVAFTTGKGEKISYPQGGFIFGYEPGQPVRVYYLPEQPADNPLIVDRGALWGTPVMLGAMGLFFTLVGSLKAIRQRGRGAVHSLKGL
ncbi:DUF3592 domain-containing protein [Pseudomonas sp. Z1-29]|uniref:DUF3592 domain-containing protein n=1 Tax=unclassified Pseudomonas TaxID=196821 RepID=UPI003DA7CE91